MNRWDWPALASMAIAFLIGATLVAPADAQTSAGVSAASQPGPALSEIVVTAQRREASLQQTPISVTTLTAQQITDFGVRDFTDYAKSVPDLSFGMGGSPFGGPAYGYSSTRQMVIRGVAGANTTSLYIDDTPIPNVVDPRVFDLERIEVLRGPQGTLFGASSMGGTVRLITPAADSKSTYGNLDLQAYNINAGGGGYDLSGTINTPVVARQAALRLSAFDRHDPGYFTKIFGRANVPGVDFAPGTDVMGAEKIGDRRTYGGAASFLIAPETIPGLSIIPLIMLQRFDVNGYPLAENTPDNLTQVRPLDVPEHSLAQWQFFAVTAKYVADFGDFISSTSLFHRYSQDQEDGTMWFAYNQGFYFSPLPYLAATVFQTYDSREVTQELRFQSHFKGRTQLVAGVFYQRAPTASPFSYPIPGLNAASGDSLGTDNISNINQTNLSKQTAGFADVSYSPIEKLELSAGIRKTWLDYSGFQSIEQPPALDANSIYSFDQKELPVTPRYAAKYNFDAADMAYASASKGFRVGGVNGPEVGPCGVGVQILGLPAGVPIPFDSDSLWSYEAGLKNLWDERKIATRAAAYYIDWRNIQQTLLLPVCGIPVQLNAGAARIIGAEGELTARITPQFELDVGAGYEDGKITQAKTLPTGQVLGFAVGTPLSGVPKWTASARVAYSAPTPFGEAFLRGEYSFVGSSLSLVNYGAGLKRGEYGLVDLSGGLRFGGWTTSLFARNLFDRAANYGDVVNAAGAVPGQTRLVIAQPRTIGLELQRSFGAR